MGGAVDAFDAPGTTQIHVQQDHDEAGPEGDKPEPRNGVYTLTQLLTGLRLDRCDRVRRVGGVPHGQGPAKDPFAHISWIPPEVPSLIQDHCETDDQLVTSAPVPKVEGYFHLVPAVVDIGIRDLDRTRVYLQVERSKAFPLEIWFGGTGRYSARVVRIRRLIGETDAFVASYGILGALYRPTTLVYSCPAPPFLRQQTVECLSHGFHFLPSILTVCGCLRVFPYNTYGSPMSRVSIPSYNLQARWPRLGLSPTSSSEGSSSEPLIMKRTNLLG